MAHLSPQAVTGLLSFVTFLLVWVAANATAIVSPVYAPIVASLAGGAAGFLVHNHYASAPPTANAGAPATVAGPPAP